MVSGMGARGLDDTAPNCRPAANGVWDILPCALAAVIGGAVFLTASGVAHLAELTVTIDDAISQ